MLWLYSYTNDKLSASYAIQIVPSAQSTQNLLAPVWSVLGSLFRSVIYDKSGESIGLSCASYYHTRSKWFTISLGMSIWWRHQMEIFSAILAICAGNSPVPGEFPAQRPVTRSFDVCFDLRPNKRLSKQWRGWWFETPSSPLCRHCNAVPRINKKTPSYQYRDFHYKGGTVLLTSRPLSNATCLKFIMW